MALNERSIDVIVRATLEQGLQPLDQVITKLGQFSKALEEQRRLATSGETTERAFTKSIQDLDSALRQLLTTRSALDDLERRQQRVDTLATRRENVTQGRDQFAANLSDTPTDAETNRLARLNKAVETVDGQYARANIALRQRIALLEQMGVLEENQTARDRARASAIANEQISANLLAGSQARQGAVGFQEGSLATTLRDAATRQQNEQIIARFNGNLKAERDKKAADDAAFLQKAQRAVGALTGQENERRAVEAERQAEKDAAQAIRDGNKIREESIASIEKATTAWFTFRDAVLAAKQAADRATTSNAASTAALHGAASAPAATLPETLRDRLGAATGAAPATITALQAEAERLDAAFTTSSSSTRILATEMQKLDAAMREVLRQAGVVSAFQAQQRAVDEARKAFSDATTEVTRLKAALETVSTPDEANAINNQIAALQRRIGAPGESGLAQRLGTERDALEKVRLELDRIGVSADYLGDAETRLTTTAVSLAKSRTQALAQEKAALDAAVEAALKHDSEIISTLSKPAAPAPRTTTQQITALIPGRTDSKAIDDTSGAVDALSTSMGKGTLTAQTYNKVMDEVFAIQRQLLHDASLIDAYKQQTDAVQKATIAYEASRAELQRVTEAAKANAATLAQVQQAEARLASAGGNLQQQREQQAAIDAQLKARRIDTANLDQETQKLIVTTNRLRTAQEGVAASSGKALGLSAFQFQNLQFQINDVITQLSLGQGVLRTFEAQAGQIFQIFELSIAQMQKLVLYGAPAAAVLLTVVSAFLRVNETAAAQRQFAGLLAGTADGAQSSATALTAVTREVERTGIAFADAAKGAATFQKLGLDTNQIRAFSLAASNMSRGLQVDFADAVKVLATVPSASFPELRKLLEDWQALTPAINDYITAQERAGDALSIGFARQAVFDALNARFKESLVSVGELRKAFLDLTNSFKDLQDAIGSEATLGGFVKEVKETIDDIRTLIGWFQAFVDLIKEPIGGPTVIAQIEADIKRALLPMRVFTDGYRSLKETLGTKSPVVALEDATKRVVDLQKQLEEAKKKLADFSTAGGTEGSPFLNAINTQIGLIQKNLDEAIAKRDKLAAAVPGAVGVAGQTGVTLPGQVSGPVTVDNSVVTPPKPFNVQAAENIAGGLVQRGMALGDALAFAANAIRESSGDPNRVNMSDAPGGSHGLFQWNKERLTAFKEANQGKLPEQTDLNTQLDFVMKEIVGKFSDAYEKIKNAASVEEKSRLVTALFEIPKDPQGQGSISAGIARALATSAGGRPNPNAPLTTVNPQQTAALNTTLTVRLTDELAKAIQDVGDNPRTQARDAAVVRTADLERRATAQKEVGTGQISEANEALLAQQSAQQITELSRKRLEQQKALEATLEEEKASLTRQIAAGDKTNADAARAVADAPFVRAFDILDKLVRQGVLSAQKAQESRDQLIGLQKTAQENATIGADEATIDAVKKARDATTGKIFDELKTGAIDIQTAGARLAEIISKFAPQIRAAVEKANADLSAQPQTPKVQQQIQQNLRIRPEAPELTKQLDDAAISRIQDLTKARSDQLAVVQDQLTRYQITQREADEKTKDIYAKTTGAINTQVDALQKLLETQKEAGLIVPEVYEKYIAQLQRVKAETDNLTASQRKFLQGVENSIVNRTTQAFQSISDAIGGAIAGTISWGDAIKQVGVAFAQFTAGVLQDIAKIIIEEQVRNAVRSSLTSSGGDSTGGILGIIGKLFGVAAGAGGGTGTLGGAYHGGGKVGGMPAITMRVNPGVFEGAQRAHDGGVVTKLASDEVPIITKIGETIRTTAQEKGLQDQMAAWKKGGMGGPESLRVVNLLKDEDVAAWINTPAGERAVLTVVQRNAPSLRQSLR